MAHIYCVCVCHFKYFLYTVYLPLTPGKEEPDNGEPGNFICPTVPPVHGETNGDAYYTVNTSLLMLCDTPAAWHCFFTRFSL